MEKFNDNSRMTFGKYKGEKMANVPASYLLWVKDNVHDADKRVLDYIEENLDLLKEESKP